MKSGTGNEQPKLRGNYRDGSDRRYLRGSLTDVEAATLDSLSDYNKFSSEKEFYELRKWMPKVEEWGYGQDGSGSADLYTIREEGYAYTEQYFS